MGKSCALFGSRVLFEPEAIVVSKLEKLLIELIQNQDVTKIYVGQYGDFERLSSRVAMKIKQMYPEHQIDVCFVAAYENDFHYAKCTFSSCILPLANKPIPRRAKIVQRNRWLVEHSDFVVDYLCNRCGGAYDTLKYAQKYFKFQKSTHATSQRIFVLTASPL